MLSDVSGIRAELGDKPTEGGSEGSLRRVQVLRCYCCSHPIRHSTFISTFFCLILYSFRLTGDVEKLLKEHRENQDLVRSIGASHYQIVFPVQLRHREKMGISTREIGATKVRSQILSFDKTKQNKFKKKSTSSKSKLYKNKMNYFVNATITKHKRPCWAFKKLTHQNLNICAFLNSLPVCVGLCTCAPHSRL